MSCRGLYDRGKGGRELSDRRMLLPLAGDVTRLVLGLRVEVLVVVVLLVVLRLVRLVRSS